MSQDLVFFLHSTATVARTVCVILYSGGSVIVRGRRTWAYSAFSFLVSNLEGWCSIEMERWLLVFFLSMALSILTWDPLLCKEISSPSNISTSLCDVPQSSFEICVDILKRSTAPTTSDDAGDGHYTAIWVYESVTRTYGSTVPMDVEWYVCDTWERSLNLLIHSRRWKMNKVRIFFIFLLCIWLNSFLLFCFVFLAE